MTERRFPIKRTLISLDCDGVLTDYLHGIPRAWEAEFGTKVSARKLGYYSASNVYGLDLTDPEVDERFFSSLGHEFWSDMPALPGALEACRILVDKGYDLVCVTAMPNRFESSRASNLKRLGFPIQRVFAQERKDGEANPKLHRLSELAPRAFVDDLLENFQGLNSGIHKAWLDAGHIDSPNRPHVEHGWHDAVHPNLLDFAESFPAVR